MILITAMLLWAIVVPYPAAQLGVRMNMQSDPGANSHQAAVAIALRGSVRNLSTAIKTLKKISGVAEMGEPSDAVNRIVDIYVLQL